MKELICHANYQKGECLFDVEREVRNGIVGINLYKINRNARFSRSSLIPNRVLEVRAEYRDIGMEYKSPFLSWYNWFFCAKWVLGMTDDRYLGTAVQRGLKTTAIVLHFHPRSRQQHRYKRRLARLPDSCGFKQRETGGFYVYHKGSIDSLFDIEAIRHIYDMHGIEELDWERIHFLTGIDLSFFGDYRTEPFNPYHPDTREEYVVNGLLLGYPVESTIALFNKTVHDFREE